MHADVVHHRKSRRISPQISNFSEISEFPSAIGGEMPDGICKDMAEADLSLFLFLMFLYKEIRLKRGKFAEHPQLLRELRSIALAQYLPQISNSRSDPIR